MIHVPDVAATADWYQALGFTVLDRGSDGEEIVFARLVLGTSELLLDAGGRASDADRREVDLYVETDDVAAAFDRLPEGVEVIEPLHDTYYGMREFIIRDCNRFWMTFGERIGRD
jgi:uncharacterized glyoxalase superfamily protein PhnB